MRRTTGALAVGIALMLLVARAAGAQPAAQIGPPLAEVEATWTAFWNHITLGDLDGALKYIHSSKRHLVPPPGGSLRELQQAAYQLAFCQIDPVPFPIREDHVWYRVRCRRGDETAEGQIGMRRDFDGVWRISAL